MAAAAAVLLFLFLLVLQAYHSSLISYLQLSQIESTSFPLVVFYLCVGAFLMFLVQSFFFARRVPRAPIKHEPDPLRAADAAVQLGDLHNAKAYLKQIPTDHPDAWLRMKLEGDVAAQMGQLDQAEEDYRNSLSHAPAEGYPIVSLALAHLYEETNRQDRAEELFRETLERAPGALEPLLRLRTFMIREQDWRQALEFQEFLEDRYSEALFSPAEQRTGVGIRFELARSEAEVRSWKTALALLKHVIRVDEKFTPAHLLLGDVQGKLENDTAAFRAWEKGYALTGHPVLLQHICEAFLMRGLPDRAIEFLRTRIEHAPEDAIPEFCLADLYMKLEMVQDAIRIYERVDQKAPNWLLNKVRMAEACRKAGQDLRAARIMGSLLDALDPTLLWKCSECDAGHSDYTALCLACFGWNTLVLNDHQAGKVEVPYGDSIRPRLQSKK